MYQFNSVAFLRKGLNKVTHILTSLSTRNRRCSLLHYRKLCSIFKEKISLEYSENQHYISENVQTIYIGMTVRCCFYLYKAIVRYRIECEFCVASSCISICNNKNLTSYCQYEFSKLNKLLQLGHTEFEKNEHTHTIITEIHVVVTRHIIKYS